MGCIVSGKDGGGVRERGIEGKVSKLVGNG